MIKKIVAGILILGLMLTPITAIATPPRYVQPQRLVIKEKVIQYGDVLRVIGIPVTDANTEYHFKTQQLNSCLTDEDAQKIAELVVKLLQDKIAKDGTGTTPAPDQPNDAEVKANALIVAKCAACHDSKAPEGQITLVTDGKLTFQDMKGKLSPSNVAWYSYEEAFAGHMPKGKPALTDDEVSILKDYATFLMKKERDDK